MLILSTVESTNVNLQTASMAPFRRHFTFTDVLVLDLEIVKKFEKYRLDF